MAAALHDHEAEDRVPGLALRFVLSAIAILGYLFIKDDLDPAPLVAARFGLGITLFALFIDLGRAIAGTAPPVSGGLGPHRQRAEPLVDDRYRDVHRAVEAFIEDGRWTRGYQDLVHEALDARDIPQATRQDALRSARAATEHDPHGHRPLGMVWVSGGVAVLGTAVIAGVLLEAIGIPLLWPVTLILGLGIYMLQLRTMRAGSRWATAGAGLLGALTVFAAGLGLDGLYGGQWWLLHLGAAILGLATLGIVAFHTFERPSWRQVRDELEAELVTLRRAFLMTLLAGLVLFPFKPLLEALFEALAWSLAVPYRMAVIGYTTVAAFLALELASAWYALARGDARETRARQDRLEANRRLLEMMETSRPAQATTGGPR